jgi:hypothetical protein
MDIILTLMAIVGQISDVKEASEDNTERVLIDAILGAFDALIAYKTQQFADTIESPEDFNTVMYEMMDMVNAAEIVEAIWIANSDESDEMPGGFSTN